METLEEYEVTEPVFVVDNDERAAWAMRKLYNIRQQMLVNERVAKAELDRVQDWLAKVNASLTRDSQYFIEQLTNYGRSQRENRKSIPLPYGTIKSRKTPDRVEVGPEFVDWAAGERDDLIVYQPPKPNLNEIKRQLKSGEKIPHAELLEGEVVFSVEVSE